MKNFRMIFLWSGWVANINIQRVQYGAEKKKNTRVMLQPHDKDWFVKIVVQQVNSTAWKNRNVVKTPSGSINDS